MKIYDITASISSNLAIFGGKRPTITPLCSISDGDKYNFSRFIGTTHIGTHADMPSHFYNNSATCDNIDLSHFYGCAKVVRIAATDHITKADLLPFDIEEGIILLIDTGQSKYMSQPELKEDFLALTPDAAQYLIEKRVKTVGIDYLSVDPYDAADFPVHMALLGNGITILEGLILEGVPEGEYTLSALPLKFEGGDGSPVRAVLVG